MRYLSVLLLCAVYLIFDRFLLFPMLFISLIWVSMVLLYSLLLCMLFKSVYISYWLVTLMRHQILKSWETVFYCYNELFPYFSIMLQCCSFVCFTLSIFHFVRSETQLYIWSYDSMIRYNTIKRIVSSAVFYTVLPFSVYNYEVNMWFKFI